MVRPIEGAGTAEEPWRDWLSTVDIPHLELGAATAAGPPLVVAPHPDDEVLGVGGLLSVLGAAEVVAVTDGEASHPDSSAVPRTTLAAMRRAETMQALRRLGLADVQVHRLGLPDGGVSERALTQVLAALLRPDRWCIATWRGDGHPDHEAVGRAAAAACRERGARLIEYPIWAWHWASPGDDALPWERARRVSLPEPVLRRKAEAISMFRSQIAPLGPEQADAAVLPPWVLVRFLRPYEVVFE
jgi:LmbE family N-acetylglucosaminyl deacetylase